MWIWRTASQWGTVLQLGHMWQCSRNVDIPPFWNFLTVAKGPHRFPWHWVLEVAGLRPGCLGHALGAVSSCAGEDPPAASCVSLFS